MIVHRVNPNNINEFPKMIENKCIVLFFHPQCSHCVHLQPTWEKMKQQNMNKNINIVEVNGEHVSGLNHPIVNNIRGFPQIIHVNKGKMQNEFIKERNLNNLNEYLRENLPNIKKKHNITKKKKTNGKKKPKKRNQKKKSKKKQKK
tara:strand:+ start:502 stop:939 length:438 start_codon:yes stop_codon:yes gene_type:complete